MLGGGPGARGFPATFEATSFRALGAFMFPSERAGSAVRALTPVRLPLPWGCYFAGSKPVSHNLASPAALVGLGHGSAGLVWCHRGRRSCPIGVPLGANEIEDPLVELEAGLCPPCVARPREGRGEGVLDRGDLEGAGGDPGPGSQELLRFGNKALQLLASAGEAVVGDGSELGRRGHANACDGRSPGAVPTGEGSPTARFSPRTSSNLT